MILLSIEEILSLHSKLIAKTGGTDGLRDYGLLPFRWQMIIERNKLIASSTNNGTLRASQMRCSLSQAKKSKLSKKKSSNQKDDEIGFEYTCKSFVKRLKEYM